MGSDTQGIIIDPLGVSIPSTSALPMPHCGPEHLSEVPKNKHSQLENLFNSNFIRSQTRAV